MTIFSRLSDIINATLNSLLDRAEDPAKLIRLVIQEMEDTLVEVRSATVRVIAERKELERRVAILGKERDEWGRKAGFALTRDREDLARGALLAKAQAARMLAEAQTQHGHIVEALRARDADIGQLQAKLADAKGREKALLTRKDTADTRLKLREKIHDNRIGDAFARFEQVEPSAHDGPIQYQPHDALGQGQALREELAELEADQSVQDELRALKARVRAAEG